MIVLDGKETAARIRAELKDEIAELTQWHGRAPGLAVILVGQDPASQVYVRNKIRASEEVGIQSLHHLLPADTTQAVLSGLIQELNGREDVDGILLQLPLPKGLNSQPCLELIRPDKDVDGFHPVNMGKLTLGLPGLRPCTPAGVMALLNRYSLSPAGTNAVVVGRSNIVGKPLALMLAQPGRDANATVTVCHSGTRDLGEECRRADFLFLAMGSPRCITRDMVKPGAVVVDIGMNRTPEGKLCGDCDYEGLKDVVAAMTPVPGGVGPMTIAQLMANTVEAYKMHVSR